MKVGDIVKLKGVSRHGKNRVREQGEFWHIVEIRDSRMHLHDLADNGNWRWVDISDDKDFEWELRGVDDVVSTM